MLLLRKHEGKVVECHSELAVVNLMIAFLPSGMLRQEAHKPEMSPGFTPPPTPTNYDIFKF